MMSNLVEDQTELLEFVFKYLKSSLIYIVVIYKAIILVILDNSKEIHCQAAHSGSNGQNYFFPILSFT